MHRIHLREQPGHRGFHRHVIGQPGKLPRCNAPSAKPGFHIRVRLIDQEGIRHRAAHGTEQSQVRHAAPAFKDGGIILHLPRHQDAPLACWRGNRGRFAGQIVFGQAAGEDRLAQRGGAGAER